MSAAAGETAENSVLGGRLTLQQPARGYRAAIDPVLLAASVTPPARGGAVLDLGCGVGTAALCYAARVPDGPVIGLELQPALADLARTNAEANGMADRVRIVTGDLLDPPPAVPGNGFARVLANPPYLAPEAADPAPQPEKAAATVEGTADLAAWIGFALSRLEPRGRLILVHRADRLADILTLLAGRAGDIAVFPLWPKPGQAAKRVIVGARKGARGGTTVLPGLVLHTADGAYTPAAEAVLRDAGKIQLTN